MHRLAVAACLAAVTAACAPVVQGGPPLALAPDLVAGSRVGLITLSSAWLDSEDDFTDTFTDEVREELSRCATGSRTLNLRVHVEDLDRESRLGALLNGAGEHRLAALVEFVDPARDDAIVGRYPIAASTPSGGAVAAVLSDRQMVVSEAFGRELCLKAYGRNPRTPGPHNATPN